MKRKLANLLWKCRRMFPFAIRSPRNGHNLIAASLCRGSRSVWLCVWIGDSGSVRSWRLA